MKPVRPGGVAAAALLFALAVAPVHAFAAAPAKDAAPVEAPADTAAEAAERERRRSVLLTARGVLENPRLVYRAAALDDRLSAALFDGYLTQLDPARMFLTAADLRALERYRDSLAAAVRDADLAGFDAIRDLVRQRARERAAFGRNLIGAPLPASPPAWADRRSAAWVEDQAGLDALWRRSHQSLSLDLRRAGHDDAAIAERLGRNYDGVAAAAWASDEAAFAAVVQAYVQAVDPHARYLSGAQVRREQPLRERAGNAWVGMELSRDGARVQVASLVGGGAALRSGAVQVGDRLLAIGEGEDGPMLDVSAAALEQASGRLFGQDGSRVRLNLVSPGEGAPVRTVALVRGLVLPDSHRVEKSVIEVGGRRIGVIRSDSFFRDLVAQQRGLEGVASFSGEAARALEELRELPVDGVLLDLRNNGGGALVEALDAAGLFVGREPVVQIREGNGRLSLDKPQTARVWDGPLAVLVDRGSAAATEIFAAAIQDRGRGLILGETTYGNGLVQNWISLDSFAASKPGRGHLKLTIAEVFRLNGEGLQGRGVTPDLALRPQAPGVALPASGGPLRIRAAKGLATSPPGPDLAALAQAHRARTGSDPGYAQWLRQRSAAGRAAPVTPAAADGAQPDPERAEAAAVLADAIGQARAAGG